MLHPVATPSNSASRRLIASKAKRRSSGIEPLESRIAPAVVVNLVGTTLTITSDAPGDSVVLHLAAGDATHLNVEANSVLVGSFLKTNFNAISITDGAGTETTTLQYTADGDPTQGDSFTLAGGGFAGNQFLLTGSNVENVVWQPSGTASSAGSLSTGAGPQLLNYSGLAGGVNVSSVSSLKLLAPTGSQSFTLDNGGAGQGSLAGTSNGFAHSLLFSAVSNLAVDLATNEVAGGSNSFTINAFAGTGLQGVAVVSGPGNDFLAINTPTLFPGGSLSWIAGAGNDTLQATADTAAMVLANNSLGYATPGQLALPNSDVEVANLIGGPGSNNFDVSNWTHGGSISGGGGLDSVFASKNTDFTLGNASLAATNGLNMILAGIGSANLTTTGNVDVSLWAHGGTINAGTISATKDASFTLANSSLASSDGMNVAINAGAANLTGGPSANSFDVSGWTKTGTITGGGGADSIVASKNSNFTLTNTSLSSSDGMSLTLSGIGAANLTGGAGNNSFDVSGWNQTGSITGNGGSDTVLATKNSNFTLTDALLAAADGLSLTLTGIGLANLTGGAGNNSFDVSGWTGGGTLDGAGGSDTIVANDNVDFTLTNTSLGRTGMTALTLANIEVANLTGGGAANAFSVSGWTGTGTLTGGGGVDTLTITKDVNFVLTDGSLATTDGMNLTLSGISTANLTGGPGANSFDVSGWTGAGTLDGAGGVDTVVASGNVDHTLTNTSLARTGAATLTLANIEVANLSGGLGNNIFTVSGWTGTGTITGGGGLDSIVAVKNSNFTLSNISLSSSDGMNLALSAIGTANLTGGAGANSFDVSGWTHGGSITGGGGSDTIAATKDSNFTLTDVLLAAADGLSLVLSGIGLANLTGVASANSFDVSGWTGAGTLDGAGGTDTVVASNNVDFTLTNSSLARTGLTTLTLANIEAATLTGGAAANNFTVSGWTGAGLITGGGGSDVITASKDVNFTLTNAGLSSSDGMALILFGIGTANLTGGGSANTFAVSNWTGLGTITGGGGADLIVATKDANFVLSNTSLATSDGMNLTLAAIGAANLTGGTSANTFTVSGWTGGGTIGGGGGADAIVATKDANFMLTNTSLVTGDGMSLTLAAIGTGNLTGGASANTFTVSGWTGGGTLDGAGASDTVSASNDVDFTLTNTSLARTGTTTLTLANMEVANLTGGASSNTFTVSGWTGTGTITGGGGADTIVAVKNSNFTLSNASLSSSDGMNLALSAIGTANLTGGVGVNSFDVSGWTHGGSITGGGGSDTIAATKDSNFTLTDVLLAAADGLSLVLSGISLANLTGGAGANSFDVSGWSGGGTLDGQGGTDTVVASNNLDFTLTNTSLARTGLATLTLANLEVANLTGGAIANTFTVSGWTGSGTITGGGGGDVIAATKNANFTLTNTSLASSDGMNLTLSGIGTANLTGGVSANSFTVSGWTGGGTLDGAGASDAVVASNDVDFTLTNTSLARVGSATLTLANMEVANLTGGASANAFTVSGWTGSGTITGGGGADVVAATKDADFTLTNTSLAANDGINLTLSAIGTANLTGGAGVNAFTVSGWTGLGTITGGGGADVVAATKDANFTLTNTSLATSDGMNLTLSAIGTANLTGGASANTFTISGWTHGGSITGGGGTDTIVASKDSNFTLTNVLLAAADGLSLVLSGIGLANLTGGASVNSFDVSGWTGGGTLDGAGGSDTIIASNNVDFTLTNTSLARSGMTPLTLANMEVANLTGGASANTFTVSGWTGGGTITGGGGADVIVAAKDTTFVLTNTSLLTSDGMNLTLSAIGTANLTGGASANFITVSGWTGSGTITGGGGSDTINVTKDVSFTLTDSSLTTSDGMSLTLSGIALANLTGGASANSINISGWTGGGIFDGGAGIDTLIATGDVDYTLTNTTLARTGASTVTIANLENPNLTGGAGNNNFNVTGWTGAGSITGGGGSDTVVASKTASFVLTNSLLTSTDGMSLTLANIGVANLTGGTGNNTFDVTGWTGTGTLDGNTGTDTIIASNNVDFVLTNSTLARTGAGTLNLVGMEAANLTGGAAANNFTVTGWTGTGTITGGGGADTITATKDTNFTLTNTSLVTGDGMNLTLSAVGIANLTGGVGANSFTVSGWTGSGTITGGGGTDVVAATKDANFTLTNSSLISSDGMSLTLAGVGTANLTGGTSVNTFTVSGWTGLGTITGGGGADVITAAKDVNFTLTNTLLASSDGMNLTLSAIGTANLTGGASANTFTVSGWTGLGTITGGGGSDVIAATKDSNFTLTNTSLATADGMNLTLAAIGTANLTGGAGANSFTVSGWTGAGTLDGAGGSDTIIATNNVDFTLTNTSLARVGTTTLTLANMELANLSGGAAVNTFTVTGWTGSGTITGGGGSDVIAATKDANFILANTSLTSSDGMSLTLSGISGANLTGGTSNNTFTVSGWTGTGTITGGGGSDTISSAKDANYTLTNTSLASSDGMSLTLAAIGTANLTGGASVNSFDVSGWTGAGTLDGAGGSDTVVASNNVDFTLTNTSLVRSGMTTLILANMEAANLTGGAAANNFTVSGWTGSGTLTGGGGSDTLTVTKDVNFTLTNASLVTSDGMNLTLSAIGTANLTGGSSANNFDVSGWTGAGTMDGAGGTDTVVASSNVDFTLTNTSLARTGATTLTLANIEVANLTGGFSNNTFTVSGWTGSGLIVGNGGSDTIAATKDANFVLGNASLSSSDGLTLALSNIGTANLTGGASNNTFDVSNWTGAGTMDGAGGNNTISATDNADFTLRNNALDRTGAATVSLANISIANLTGGVGNNTFTVNGWTQNGTISGGGGTDTLVAAKLNAAANNLTLTNTSFVATGGENLILSGISVANLTGGTGNTVFDVSGWTGSGIITGGSAADTIAATKNVNFTLTSASLTTTDGMSLSLANIRSVNLTGGAGSNTFTVSGWTGLGTLAGGGGSDSVIAQKDSNFTLTNTSLTSSDGMNFTLSAIGTANLTGGPGGNIFTVSGWTGTGSITGAGGPDAVVAAKDASFTLANNSLTSSDGMNLTLSAIGAANLTGGASNNSFNVSAWTGLGTITGGGGSDTIVAGKDANFMLANTSLSASDGMNLGLSAIGTANLTGGPGSNNFDVSGWTGAGTIDGSGNGDTVIATNDADMTLTNSSLARTGTTTLTLVNIEHAILTGGASNNNFTVSGWTGDGSLSGGGGTDTVTSVKAGGAVLANAQLTTDDGMTLGLVGINVAALTDTAGGAHTFTVTDWTHGGSLTSQNGTDTVVATKDANFTLTDTSLASSDGMSITLAGITMAHLTGGASGNSFDVSGWSGSGSLDGLGGTDTVIATNNLDFTLTNTSLARGALPVLTLGNIEAANLTGGAGDNNFTVSGWTGSGTLTGGGGSDTITAVKDTNFTLKSNALVTTDGMNLALAAIGTANLIGGAGGNSFDVSLWTGGGTLDGAGGSDTLVSSNNADFTLTNTSLARTSLPTITLANIEVANLTGSAGSNGFTVSGWTGTGTIAGGGGSDTIVAVKDSNFTLTNASLVTGDGMSLALSGIGMANLTGGAGNNSFTVSGWTGTGAITGGGGSDTIIAVKDANFVLSNSALASSDGMDLFLSAMGTANLTGGAGNNSFDVSSWTGAGTLDGVGGTDTVVAGNDVDFTLTNSSLARTGMTTLTLANIEAANLTGGAGNNLFTVTGWTGTGTITGGGGSDTITATKDVNFALADASLATSDGMNLALSGIGTATLTGGAGANSFDVSGWTGAGTIDGAGGTDTVVASNNSDFTLTNTSLARTGTTTLTLANIEAATLTGGVGANTFTVSGWTGTGTLNGGGGSDTIAATKDANFTLTDLSLATSDGMSMNLAGIETANLTGGASANTFTVSGWTGHGTITGGGGSDTIAATKDANFTLTDSSLGTSDGMTLALLAIGTANLTGGASANSFDVSGWTGAGTLDGAGGSDTVVASDDTDFTLANGSLARGGATTLTLANIEAASLTGGAGNNTFTVSGWTGTGAITGGGGSDTIVAVKDANFTLTDTSLATTDNMSLTLAGVGTANLTGGPGVNTFDVSLWTGGGTLDGAGGADTVIASDNVDFTLTNTTLSRTGGAADLTLVNIEAANLTGGSGDNNFTVSSWTGIGTITGSGGTDTITAVKDANFTLTDTSLATSDHMSLTLSGIKVANLTGGAGANSFDVSGWTGGGTLDGQGGSDTVVATDNTDFTLTNTSLARTGSTVLTLANIENANLTGGAGNNTFTVSGWTGGGTIAGGGGSDTVVAVKNADFTLTDTSLVTSDGLNLALNAIHTANLTGGAGDNTFTVSGWSGLGTLDGGGGSDTVAATKDNSNLVLTDALLYSTRDLMQLTLTNIGSANLTAGAGDDVLDGWGFHGNLTLNGGAGNDKLIAGHGVNLLKGGIMADVFFLSGQSITDELVPSQDGLTNVVINGLQQRDRIDYSAASGPKGVTVNLSKVNVQQTVNNNLNMQTKGLLKLDGLFNDLVGSKFVDKLTGNKLVNIIVGNGKADTLAGNGTPTRKADYLFGAVGSHFTRPLPGEIDVRSSGKSPFPPSPSVTVPQAILDIIARAPLTDPVDPFLKKA